MQHKHRIELNIVLADGGRGARDIIELYGNQVSDDIDQTSWNLCDCDDQVQSEKFFNLTLVDWAVTQDHGEGFHVKAKLTVNAQDDEFVNQVIEEYMNDFAYCICTTQNGYYSRTGKKVSLNLNPLYWDCEIK